MLFIIQRKNYFNIKIFMRSIVVRVNFGYSYKKKWTKKIYVQRYVLPHSAASHFIEQSNKSVNNCAYPAENTHTRFHIVSIHICEAFSYENPFEVSAINVAIIVAVRWACLSYHLTGNEWNQWPRCNWIDNDFFSLDCIGLRIVLCSQLHANLFGF